MIKNDPSFHHPRLPGEAGKSSAGPHLGKTFVDESFAPSSCRCARSSACLFIFVQDGEVQITGLIALVMARRSADREMMDTEVRTLWL